MAELADALPHRLVERIRRAAGVERGEQGARLVDLLLLERARECLLENVGEPVEHELPFAETLEARRRHEAAEREVIGGTLAHRRRHELEARERVRIGEENAVRDLVHVPPSCDAAQASAWTLHYV